MLKFLKVTGESLSPFFESGDYVLALGRPFAGWRLRPGQTLIFRHPYYGTLIKRLERILPGDELFVVGTHPDSTDSRSFGPIPRQWITGRVIGRIKKPL